MKHTSILQKQATFYVICSLRVKTRNVRLHQRSFYNLSMALPRENPILLLVNNKSVYQTAHPYSLISAFDSLESAGFM